MGDAMQHFYAIFEAIPRQGPGEREATLLALASLPPLVPGARLLDIGCGKGAQTFDLAQATAAHITALDNHGPFLAEVHRRAAELGLEGRVTAQLGDMAALPFDDGSFEVVWAEGSIFVVGFARGLALWRRLLVPGGHLVVSELCWLGPDRPDEVVAFFAEEGAEVADLATRRAQVEAAGYELVADFPLPASGWIERYYAPLAEACHRYLAEHDEPEARAVVANVEREIDVYRRYPGCYGYVFFVMRRPEAPEPRGD